MNFVLVLGVFDFLTAVGFLLQGDLTVSLFQPVFSLFGLHLAPFDATNAFNMMLGCVLLGYSVNTMYDGWTRPDRHNFTKNVYARLGVAAGSLTAYYLTHDLVFAVWALFPISYAILAHLLKPAAATSARTKSS